MKKVKQLIRRSIPLLMMLLFFAAAASAQQGIDVTGTVVDSNGESIIGATVKVKGSSSVSHRAGWSLTRC